MTTYAILADVTPSRATVADIIGSDDLELLAELLADVADNHLVALATSDMAEGDRVYLAAVEIVTDPLAHAHDITGRDVGPEHAIHDTSPLAGDY